MHLKKKNRDGLTYLEWCLKAGIGDMDVASFMAVRETCELAWEEGANPNVVQLILFVKEGVDFPLGQDNEIPFDANPVSSLKLKLVEVRKSFPELTPSLLSTLMSMQEKYLRKLAKDAGVPWE